MTDQDMTDSEFWQQHREEQKARRQARLPVRASEIEALEQEGYIVERKTPYQYRINRVLDLYPVHNRWHHINTGQRGGAKNLAAHVRKTLRPYYRMPTTEAADAHDDRTG